MNKILVLLSALVSACTAIEGDLQAVGKVAYVATEFGKTVHTMVGNSKPGQNFVMSSYSLDTALAMAYLGTEGYTHHEMKRILGFPDYQDFIAGFQALQLAFNQ